MVWKLGQESWQLTCRPTLPEGIAELYTTGGADRLTTAANRTRQSDPVLAGWLLHEAARTLAKSQDWKGADEAFAGSVSALEDTAPVGAVQALIAWAETFRQRGMIPDSKQRWDRAIEVSRRAKPGSLYLAATLAARGDSAMAREDFAGAEKDFQEALAIREKLAPGSVAAAQVLSRMGVNERRLGKLDEAETHLKRAIEHLEAAAPGGLDLAGALTGLGTTYADLARHTEARACFDRALEIQQRLAPSSSQVASTLNNLGLLLQDMGEMLEAQNRFLAALSINQKIAPDGIEVARNLSNLGRVANERGFVAEAEDSLRRALEIQTRLAPGSFSVGISLANLGAVSRDRWDLAGAEDYYQQALDILQKVAPQSPVVPGLELNMGDVALERGNFVRAERQFQSALTRYQKVGPETPDVATALHALAGVSKRNGNLAQAAARYQQALAILEKLAPSGLDIASALQDFAELEEQRREYANAERDYRRALEIRSKLAPGARIEAETLYGLARIAREQRDGALAARNFQAALESLESQTYRLGGPEEVRAGFGARNNGIYRDYMDLLLESGDAAGAFHVLERSRARDLLRMLAERDLNLKSYIPADVEKRLRTNAAEYDRVQSGIGDLDPVKDAAAIGNQVKRLHELSAERARMDEQIKAASPRLASLRYPKPLDVEGAAAALDPGTLLLSYAVGEERTVLFALRLEDGKPRLSTFALPIRKTALRDRITAFLREIVTPSPSRTAERSSARALYHDLLSPADTLIDTADRILIVPDGPLHTLPFAALMRADRYLIEWKPLHTAVSATVYAELRKSRRAPDKAPVQLAIFGDPVFPRSSNDQNTRSRDADLRMAGERGLDFAPLRFSRAEVEGIASLFKGNSRVFLGERATEAAAKKLPADIQLLHFATHGVLDERIPLNSAIVLSMPGEGRQQGDNGLLQAWEIIEDVRWNADLVVLSACRTGLGEELAGEGLVGLTRAIQFAGARTVLASLWNVDDRRTAALMTDFYTGLRQGKSKDEAFRAAQIRMLKSAASRPFYWAAFTLNGDWR